MEIINEQLIDSPVNGQPGTEARLRSSAIKLFAAKGYDATSIRDIIEDAGVTRPVVYYYFKNKEDLFSSLVESEFRDGLREMDAQISMASNFRDALIRIARISFAHAEESPEIVQMLLQFFFAPPEGGVAIDRRAFANERMRRIASVVQGGLDAGEISGGDAYSLAVVFSGIMDMHVMAKSSRPEGRLTPELAESLVDLFLNGARAGHELRSPLRSSFDFESAGGNPPVTQG